MPGNHFMILGRQKATLKKGWTWSTDYPTNSFPYIKPLLQVTDLSLFLCT